jgi:hypothetical protein
MRIIIAGVLKERKHHLPMSNVHRGQDQCEVTETL